ncbi:hypothetical protein CRG98_014719 [Punica granatum]|uniref:Uncharacterized protein n=1 Tax=Punica granatum TaxID=22663 RepID=A0A2I0KAT6_PUNGR|nr:hypothetical protein CRG98_014719 [Punica granatum]
MAEPLTFIRHWSNDLRFLQRHNRLHLLHSSSRFIIKLRKSPRQRLSRFGGGRAYLLVTTPTDGGVAQRERGRRTNKHVVAWERSWSEGTKEEKVEELLVAGLCEGGGEEWDGSNKHNEECEWSWRGTKGEVRAAVSRRS